MSKIEWCDDTINFLAGCTRVSRGCDHCYSATMTKRLAGMGQEDYAGLINDEKKHFNGTVKLRPERLSIPLKWRKPKRVFVNSMSDTWHPDVPFDFIAAMFGVMAATPHITYQLLTKRPERMLEWFEWIQSIPRAPEQSAMMQAEDHVGILRRNHDGWPLDNVWLGVSCEDQDALDARLPLLAQCPAAIRFLSCEPLLGPIDLCLEHYEPGIRPDWIIIGGESGPRARTLDVESVRSIISQCAEHDSTACFVKQLGRHPVELVSVIGKPGETSWRTVQLRDRKGGSMEEWPEELRVRQFPDLELVSG